MTGAPKGLIIISGISLILAVIGTFGCDIANITPEGFSRASANTALLAFGWHLIMGDDSSGYLERT